jgi:catechol 2,3-dioxygenase-like lactoylglutathione lyase family enzyme
MGLSDAKVAPTIAVSDMQTANDFYEGKLGLSGGSDTGDGGRDYPCGEGTLLHVFPNPDGAGKSPATVVGWAVDDVEAAVEELSGKGVTFEQYGEPFSTDERGIADFQDAKGAWFKDPDGNVHAIFDA